MFKPVKRCIGGLVTSEPHSLIRLDSWHVGVRGTARLGSSMIDCNSCTSDAHAGPRRIWCRILVWTGVALLLLACGIALRLYYVSQPKNVITIGPDTTVLDGPLAPDGLVDLVTAFDQQLSAGVTAENNAAIPLLEAFGPAVIPDEYRTRFCAALGCPTPPVAGDYVVGPAPFAEMRFSALPEGGVDLQQQFIEVQLKQCVSRPWSRDDFPEVASWLDANEPALARIAVALQRDHFYIPLGDDKGAFDGLQTVFPQRQQCMDATRLFVARAMLQLASGDLGSAWRNLEACHRFPRVACDPTLIGWLIADAVERGAYDADRSFWQAGELTAEQSRRCAADLAALPPLPALAAMFDESERFETIGRIQDMARGDTYELDHDVRKLGVVLNAVIDWNACLRRVNRHHDELVAALRLERYADRVQQLRAIDARCDAEPVAFSDAGSLLREFVRSGSAEVGEKLALSIVCSAESAETMLRVEAASIARLELSRLGFGLAAYHANHGAYPESLAALAPGDLPSVPQDPYSGKNFVYRRVADGYQLYSVGHNLTDDGGRGRSSEPQGDDIGIEPGIPGSQERAAVAGEE
jgi:hypothetical protein